MLRLNKFYWFCNLDFISPKNLWIFEIDGLDALNILYQQIGNSIAMENHDAHHVE